MFFIIAQIVSFITSPLTWIIVLLLLAVFVKNKKWAKRFLIYSLIFTLFFTNNFFADEAIHLWEYPITNDKDLTETYDVGIVLGGGMVTIDAPSQRMTFRNNMDRLMQSILLYKQGKIKKMLFSSGSGSLVYRDMRESALIRKYLLTIGIPDSDILIDSISDNTYQHAVFSAQILKKKYPNGKYLLITSSTHMRRAQGCFKKAEISVIPYSTGLQIGKRMIDLKHYIIPNLGALGTWDKLIHEVIGYIVYAIKGYL